MWTPVRLPYFKPADRLPAKLPTASEIRASPAIIKQRTGQAVVAASPQVLVKYGRGTAQREGQALLYLEDCIPSVPAPRLYAMFEDSKDLFIIMERIPGTDLESVWDDLSEERKSVLMQDLRTTFTEMRKAVCPWPNHFGAVDGGPVPDPLFYSATGDVKICGPFNNEESFNQGLALRHKTLMQSNGQPGFKSDFFRRHLREVLQRHKSTFTHSDVQRKNVVVVEQSQFTPDHIKPFRIALVDWEDAGWYPEYWEYFSAFASFRWDDDWCDRVEDFITACPAETSIMMMIYADLWL